MLICSKICNAKHIVTWHNVLILDLKRWVSVKPSIVKSNKYTAVQHWRAECVNFKQTNGDI